MTTEIITLKAGVLGIEREGIATAVVEIDLDMTGGQIGHALATTYRKLLLEVLKDLATTLPYDLNERPQSGD